MKWYFVLNEQAHPQYIEAAKVAVLSCRGNTSLAMNCLWDGGETAFTEWLGVNGVTVHRAVVPFLGELQARAAVRGLVPKAARGAYLRTQIPVVENDDKFVLYTDCDVIFQSDPVPYLSTLAPRLIGATLESSSIRTQFFNSGVMLLNVPALKRVQDEFVSFIKDNLPDWVGFSANDQGAYNYFFRGQWEYIDEALNWKPYWGDNPNAVIVHFHGMRPHEATSFVAGGHSHESKKGFMAGKNVDSLSRYSELYYTYIFKIYELVSHIKALRMDGDNLIVTIWAGGDVIAQPQLGIELRSGCQEPVRLPVSASCAAGEAFEVKVPCPAKNSDGQAQQVRARLVHLQHHWFTTNEDASKPGEKGAFVIRDTEALPPGRITHVRERIWQSALDGSRPFYIGVKSSLKLSIKGGSPVVESISEAEFSPTVIQRTSIDVASDAMILMPHGVTLFADGSVEQSDARRIFGESAFRPELEPYFKYDGTKLVPKRAIDPMRLLPRANLLAVPRSDRLTVWLPDLVAKLTLFERHPSTRLNPYVTSPLSPAQRAAFRLLNIDDGRIINEAGWCWYRVEQLNVIVRRGSERSLSWVRKPHDAWPGEPLDQHFPPARNGTPLIVTTSVDSGSPALAILTEDLLKAGWNELRVDDAPLEQVIRMIRGASLITMFGEDAGGLLSVASPSASVQEIQFGAAVRPSDIYRMAMAKSLAYSAVLIDCQIADQRAAAVASIQQSAKQLMRSNVVSFLHP